LAVTQCRPGKGGGKTGEPGEGGSLPRGKKKAESSSVLHGGSAAKPPTGKKKESKSAKKRPNSILGRH